MIHVATDDFLIAHNDSDIISNFIEDYQQFAPIRPCQEVPQLEHQSE